MRFAHMGLFVLSTIWIPAISQALTFDCERVKDGDVEWHLENLKGPRSVHHIIPESAGSNNLTFTIDLCEALQKDDESEKDCPNGTRICASRSHIDKDPDKEPTLEDRWPVAGQFIHEHRMLEPTVERLKSSNSHSDTNKEGLRVEFQGGKNEAGEKQKAIIELICDKTRSGREGPSGEEPKEEEKRRRADDDDTEGGDDDSEDKKSSDDGDQSLQFVSYADEPQTKGATMGVLRLEWKTKFACEDQKDVKLPEPNPKKKNSWGFFTWFIIIFFLAIASYLIFGSWLNYNRHGARGWDLLPHGDTIRDLPYLVKDWGRRVVSTVQGNSGSGRGYLRV